MIYIIDSAAVLNDELFSFEEHKKYVTTYRVTLEFKDFRSRLLVDNAIKSGFLVIMEPGDKSVEKVEVLAKKTGSKLSDADISLIALSVELKEKEQVVVVVTDDFSVQNLLLRLQVPFQSVIRGEIKKFMEFK